MVVGLILLAAIVLVILFLVGIYNRLVTLRNRFKNAFSQIDVQLKRRYDLIPNLVETAKGYMKHERETLEAVIQARNQAVSAAGRAAAFAENLAARIAGLAEPPAIVRAGSVLWFHVSRQTPRRVDAIDSRQGTWFARVFHAALARGVYLPPSGFEVLFLSLAHDDACLVRAADAIAGAMIEAAA